MDILIFLNRNKKTVSVGLGGGNSGAVEEAH